MLYKRFNKFLESKEYSETFFVTMVQELSLDYDIEILPLETNVYFDLDYKWYYFEYESRFLNDEEMMKDLEKFRNNVIGFYRMDHFEDMIKIQSIYDIFGNSSDGTFIYIKSKVPFNPYPEFNKIGLVNDCKINGNHLEMDIKKDDIIHFVDNIKDYYPLNEEQLNDAEIIIEAWYNEAIEDEPELDYVLKSPSELVEDYKIYYKEMLHKHIIDTIQTDISGCAITENGENKYTLKIKFNTPYKFNFVDAQEFKFLAQYIIMSIESFYVGSNFSSWGITDISVYDFCEEVLEKANN